MLTADPLGASLRVLADFWPFAAILVLLALAWVLVRVLRPRPQPARGTPGFQRARILPDPVAELAARDQERLGGAPVAPWETRSEPPAAAVRPKVDHGKLPLADDEAESGAGSAGADDRQPGSGDGARKAG